ncbi:MAG TPA: MSMEG_1061 family FMN-dependent PPOX-type flavoprotein, partial [Thermomicrobiales bacterium]|nr:MSMEG_1061 family FMN-dependent PPOX-type flavoprotein [Thermomicrobiales bacterium]
IRDYIHASPFFLLGTSDALGNCDVTPRGDTTSVIRILDDQTLVIPDRPGNKRADSFRNILGNPHVGLLFVIPGVEEALRINGRATITKDPEILAEMSIQGKQPVLGIAVEIDEVFVHCARAMLRARLWKPETWPDDDAIPTLAAIWNEQKNLPPPDESAGKRREEYRERLY